MSFDDVTLWLVTAMSFFAVALLFWTLVAVVRTSRAARFVIGGEHGHPLSGMTPTDPGSA